MSEPSITDGLAGGASGAWGAADASGGAEPVRIEPYDPVWPERFGEERAALEEAIGNRAPGGIHHVGSTAVPGLDAKPIVDILVGIESLAAARPCFEPLTALGYRHFPHRPDEMHWFCKPNPQRRTHHLHLVPTGSPRFRAELAFRDLLRAEPGLAREYAALKHRLATRFATDRESYTVAKAEFIRTALERAGTVGRRGLTAGGPAGRRASGRLSRRS